MQICRICLNIDRKMYPFNSKRVHLYEKITGAAFASQDLLPKYVCWECDHYMSKYVGCRSKAIKSLRILNEILSKEGLITPMNCSQYKLKSNLTIADVFTDVYIFEEENVDLLESELKIENDSVERIINNYDLDQDLMNDNRNSDAIGKTTPLSQRVLCCKIKMQICRICMNFDRKMYLLNGKRRHLYLQMTSTAFASQDLLPKYVCWECDHYMSKYVAFRSKAIRSLHILNKILSKEGLITQTNCNQYKLKSNLTISDGFTDVYTFEEQNVDLLEPSSEVKIENESVGSNINNFTDAMYYVFDEDFINDNQITDEIIIDNNMTDNMTSSSSIKEEVDTTPSSPTEEYKDLVKGNRRSPDKMIKSVKDEIDKEIMKATKLTMEEQIADVQNRKESDNYKNSTFKCVICFRGFKDDNSFDRHMAKHSESRGAFECPLCKMRYSKQSKMNAHVRENHVYEFRCQQCNFRSRYRKAAIKHQNYHKWENYICPQCNEAFEHESSYNNHVRIKHPSGVFCQYCGHSFINEKDLRFHIKYAHRDDKTRPIPEDGPYCERCDIQFMSLDALDTHKQLSDRHTDERNFERVRRQSRKTRRNMKLASEPFADGPRQCEQCDELLPTPRAYWVHFRKEHKDKNRTIFYNKRNRHLHMCEVCGKMFQNFAHLGYHQYVHSETKQFKCERCGKRFQLESRLKRHQKHHCGVREPYTCTVCGRQLSNYNNLYRHMVLHTGIKAYKCEICGKAFAQMCEKKVHVECVHYKKPWPKRNRARKRAEKQEEMVQSPYEAAEIEQEME